MRPNQSSSPLPEKTGLARHGERRMGRIEDLPPPGIKRWVIRRKAEVVTAVRAGLLTLEEALARYGLSREEFEAWRGAFARHGMSGLRTTQRGDRGV
jgi:hypothetical protein